MNTFRTFPEIIVIKILKFWVHFAANISKTVIEIIHRNVTSNMRVFIFTSYKLFPTTFCGVISADCINIIEINILSLLDDTRYFNP